MADLIKLVIVPQRVDLTGGEAPKVTTMSSTRVDGTLVVIAHANSAQISDEAMLDGVIAGLRREDLPEA